jgi:hypothetical protein
MKRTVVACALIAAVSFALVVPAEAAKTRSKRITRRAEAAYALPYLISPSISGGGCFTVGVAGNECPVFTISKTEEWVTMEVHDESGTPSAFSIWQKGESDGMSFTVMGGPFCGSSGKDAVRIAPGVDVGVAVYAFGDVVCPGAIATSGTVTAVFSNVP